MRCILCAKVRDSLVPHDYDVRSLMVRETSYFVQAFNAGKDGNSRPTLR